MHFDTGDKTNANQVGEHDPGANGQRLEYAPYNETDSDKVDLHRDKTLKTGERMPTGDAGRSSLAPPTSHSLTAVHDEIQGPQESSTEEGAPESSADDEQKRPRTVRFNSRVRITSGIGHFLRRESSQRDSSTSPIENGAGPTSAPRTPIDMPDQLAPHKSLDSSASASYSSSISAPLRSSSEHPPRSSSVRLSRKLRAPLSDLLDATDTNAWLQSLTNERRKRNKKRRNNEVDERSPLLPQAARGILLHDPTNQFVPPDGNGIKPNTTENETKWPKWLTLYYWEARLSALCCCEAEIDD